MASWYSRSDGRWAGSSSSSSSSSNSGSKHWRTRLIVACMLLAAVGLAGVLAYTWSTHQGTVATDDIISSSSSISTSSMGDSDNGGGDGEDAQEDGDGNGDTAQQAAKAGEESLAYQFPEFVPNLAPLEAHRIDTEDVEQALLAGRFQLWVYVIAYNRPSSMQRLCESLLAADYLGDRVNVRFLVDVPAGEPPNEEVLAYIHDFEWPHGQKLVSTRFRNAGLVKNIIESWYPADMGEYVLFAEDDIELSKHWYAWVKDAVFRYRFGGSHDATRDPKIFGVSLYTPREMETTPPAQRTDFFHPWNILQNGDRPYLHQMPCSWGAVYFPEHWRTFRRYVSVRETVWHLTPNVTSYTNGWSGSWVKWYYELAYFKGWYMVYPNFEGEVSFSTNHAESGVHISSTGSRVNSFEFTVPLASTPTYQAPPFDPVSRMKVFDQQKELVESGHVLVERGQRLLHGRHDSFICNCGVDCGRAVARALGERWTVADSWLHAANREECLQQMKEAEAKAAEEREKLGGISARSLKELAQQLRALASDPADRPHAKRPPKPIFIREPCSWWWPVVLLAVAVAAIAAAIAAVVTACACQARRKYLKQQKQEERQRQHQQQQLQQQQQQQQQHVHSSPGGGQRRTPRLRALSNSSRYV